MTGSNAFRLLNVEHPIDSAGDWNAPHIEKLWLYNLHYHEWLSACHSHVDSQRRLLQRWIAENLPPIGVGWDAYPISLRTVQWIKWLARGETPVDGMLESLATQVRYLRLILETHLGANHLFANAIALTAAGAFFDSQESNEWLNTGLAILGRQFPIQFRDDGGHFELSPSYHALLLESILDVENLFRAYGLKGARPWVEALPRLREWIAVMTRPDGTFAQFNDCAQNVAPSTAQIESYAAEIGLEPSQISTRPVIDLRDTGYTRLCNSTFDVFVDAGSFAPLTQPGHGHCDMLSFELSFNGTSIIVNGGTSTYEPTILRSIERSTTSHNTVQVDGAEQTEIWSAFRAGRRANILERVVHDNGIVASHDGYRTLGIIHRRTFRLHNQRLVITDELLGKGPAKKSIARIHFAPGILPEHRDGAVFAGPLSISTRGANDTLIREYKYAPEFNRRLPAKVLEVEFTEHLQTVISCA